MTFTIGSQVTPLHAAARGNQPQIVKRLIEAGADPGMRGGYDDAMPLHLAAWHDCADAAQALTTEAPILMLDPVGYTTTRQRDGQSLVDRLVCSKRSSVRVLPFFRIFSVIVSRGIWSV